MVLCSPGHITGISNDFSFAAKDLSPHSSTNPTSRIYGTHAVKISLPECFCTPRLPGLMMIIRSTAPIAAVDERMSVSCTPTKLDTKNWVPANAIPQNSVAGSTARSPFQPDITIIRYEGTNNEIGAQIRPTAALSFSTGNPVVTASVVTGMPRDPNATGAVFASRQIAAA